MIQSINRIDSYVGSRVRFQRSLLGMSETVFADAIGVTERQLQEYECGAVRIGAQHLLKITKILKISAAFFFDGLASEGARRVDDEARQTAADAVADAASAAKNRAPIDLPFRSGTRKRDERSSQRLRRSSRPSYLPRRSKRADTTRAPTPLRSNPSALAWACRSGGGGQPDAPCEGEGGNCRIPIDRHVDGPQSEAIFGRVDRGFGPPCARAKPASAAAEFDRLAGTFHGPRIRAWFTSLSRGIAGAHRRHPQVEAFQRLHPDRRTPPGHAGAAYAG